MPSRGYVESLLRLAGLLHDVGHGPFGHFFDEHFLRDSGLTHETLGSQIIRDELGDLIRGMRRNPHSRLAEGRKLDPAQIAYLDHASPADRGRRRHRDGCASSAACSAACTPSTTWISCSATPTCRATTVAGFRSRTFAALQLFQRVGLTIHTRGVPALVRFIGVRAELFRSIYFHRTVRSIDLSLADLFVDSGAYLFPGQSTRASGRISAFHRVVVAGGRGPLVEKRGSSAVAHSVIAGEICSGAASALADGVRADRVFRTPLANGEHLQPARVLRTGFA